MEQRKKVLITNLYFQKFTGSELHVLEFAHLFKEKGYDVVIAVYKKSYPLLQELEEGITVIECQKEALKEMEFEIVFIQHFPVFHPDTGIHGKSEWLFRTAETACDCLLKQLLQGVGVSRKKISKNQRSDQWTRES